MIRGVATLVLILMASWVMQGWRPGDRLNNWMTTLFLCFMGLLIWLVWQ